MVDGVWQTVLAILASFGGAGFIILAVSKWVANLTAEKILKKTEFEFSQKLEALKSNLEKKNYVSKVRFDLEIDVYRSLSRVILDLAERCSHLLICSIDSHVEREPDKYEKQSIDSANEIMNIARAEIMRNAAFIPQKTYEIFIDLYDECEKQCRTATYFALGYSASNSIKRDLKEFKKREKAIEVKKSALIDKLREHIASLDVLDK